MTRPGRLLLVLTTTFVIAGCAQNRMQGGNAALTMANDEKNVTITLNGTGLPVPSVDPVVVKKDKDKVRWCADFAFSITIEGATADSTAGPSGCDQTVKKGPWGKTGRIKYSITANGQTNDPTVDVQPGP